MIHSHKKEKIKVLLLEGVHLSAAQTFQRAGYLNIEQISKALSQEELIKKLKDCKILGIRSRTQMTSTVLQESPNLLAIGCFCIGTNQVSLKSAEKLGIPVFNAPFSNTRSVAELIIGEIIMLARGIHEKSMLAHQGIWLKSANSSYEVRGKTLGIIGYGHIGSQLSILAESLGIKVIFYDIENKLPLGNASSVDSLSLLLKNSDIVSMHVPETELTKNMISEHEFSLMRDKSIFINASRGSVVDIDALSKAIKNQRLAGAAIDVFPKEPKSNQDKFISPLIGLNNVILTPHIGGSTLEAQQNIGSEVAEKLIKYSDNGSTLQTANFPQVSLPVHEKVCRILHIHQNKPGMMRLINRLFSDNEINISAQYLETTQNIGYVVIDINADINTAQEMVKKLSAIEGTIKARTLF